MNTVGKAMKYISLVNSNYLKIYPDTGNITNAAVTWAHDVCEDLRLGAGNLVALHLKESKPGVFREVPFLTGHVNFEAAIAEAWKLGVRRFVTELWYIGNPDWRGEVGEAVQIMRRILDAQE